MTETYLTRAGYEKLVKDLESLRKQRTQLSREIEEAREKGDLKENAEYHAAKERQSEILRRIQELDAKLGKAQLIDDLKVEKGLVQIGVTVTLREIESGDDFEWTLVGPEEADPAKGKLSVYSPLAQGILGKKVGNEVLVTLPAGAKKFKVLKTEPAH